MPILGIGIYLLDEFRIDDIGMSREKHHYIITAVISFDVFSSDIITISNNYRVIWKQSGAVPYLCLGMKSIGKPGAGKSHARFDEGALRK